MTLYNNCIFDYICISKSLIFECKLNIKDFNEKQYQKYKSVTNYNIIYLIGTDCIINIYTESIYTTDYKKYLKYIKNIPNLSKPNFLDNIIKNFKIIEIQEIDNIYDYCLDYDYNDIFFINEDRYDLKDIDKKNMYYIFTMNNIDKSEYLNIQYVNCKSNMNVKIIYYIEKYRKNKNIHIPNPDKIVSEYIYENNLINIIIL